MRFLAAILLLPAIAWAQRVTPAFDTARSVAGDASLGFLIEGDSLGEITVVLGTTDLGAYLQRAGRRLTLGARPFRLPPGNQELIIYGVQNGAWNEIGRATVHVLTRGGFEKAQATPALTLNNAGQLTERASAGQPEPPRPTFQDFTGSAGMTTTLQRGRTTFESRWNVLGASKREQTLRFGTRRDRAPRVDLSDFALKLAAGPTSLSLGHVSVGTSRHLINNLSTRGVVTTLGRGPATFTLGVVNGASMVGWDNLIGLGNTRHQMRNAMLGVDLVASRPGAIRLELSALDGSTEPNAGFTRGAILDAETSDGGSVQLSAATPGQRLRFATGYSTSRFSLATDPELAGDTTLTPVSRERRGARFAELTVGVVQGKQLARNFPLSLSTTLRHERIDPLYRSVAAPLQADRDQTGGEMQMTVGPMSLLVSHGRTGDNLDDVPSVLRTLQRATMASFSAPLGTVVGGTRGPWFPTLTWSLNRTHALADGVPVNGAFRPNDLPDQVSIATDVGGQWSIGRWRLGLRHNQSKQDNRQSGRERADFETSVDALTLGLAVGATFDIALDGSLERQDNLELAQTNRLTRLGTLINWRLPTHTQLAGAVSLVGTRDEPRTSRATNVDLHAELSQGVSARSLGGERGRVFVRYARQSARTTPMIPLPTGDTGRVARWTLASGLSIRVF
jgi:hypothetical protein